jgi:hypothetical protein
MPPAHVFADTYQNIDRIRLKGNERVKARVDEILQEATKKVVHHIEYTCPFRKSYPDVLMMQPGQDGNGDNNPAPLDCTMQRRIFL